MSSMSELEREEFTRRINGMSEEEKMLAVSLLPSDILVLELGKRLLEQERKISYATRDLQ